MRTHLSRRARWSLARDLSLLAVAVALPATATGQISVTPFGGAFMPLRPLVDQSAAAGGMDAHLKLEQRLGFLAGGSVHQWISTRYGLKGTFGYGWSDLKGTGSISDSEENFTASASENAQVMLGSAKLLVGLAGAPTAQNMFYVGIGPSIVHRTSSLFDEQDGVKIDAPTDLGGAVEFAGDFRIGDGLRLHTGLESFLYSTTITARDVTNDARFDFGSEFQADVVASVGLSFQFGGKATQPAPPVVAGNRNR